MPVFVRAPAPEHNLPTERDMDHTRRPGASIWDFVGVILGAFLLAAAATAADGWPLPSVHDEFSLIRAGETFATGRAAYPAPLEADAFATFHTLTQPTYATKYLPAHPLFLALGIRVAGSPRAGQWLAFAVCALSIFYLILPFGRTSAWVVTLLASVALADTAWTSGYFGSSVAAAGACLLLGAAMRLRDRPGLRSGLTAGLGASLLLASRPWEGFWAGLPIASLLLWLAVRHDRAVRGPLVAAGVVLAATVVLLGRYNRAVTGSWSLPAYVLYEREVGGGAPPFVWQDTTRARATRVNARVRDNDDLQRYREIRTAPGRTLVARARRSAEYFGEVALAGAALLAVFALTGGSGYVLASLLGAVGAVGVASFFTPHYLGVAIAPLLWLSASGAQRVTASRRGTRALGILSVVILASGLYRIAVRDAAEEQRIGASAWQVRRADVAARVAAGAPPGRQVVFVKYGPTYTARYEWVQNPADLQHAPILWVHDRGDSANRALLAAWPATRTWHLRLEHNARGVAALLDRYGTPRHDVPTMAAP